MHSWLVDMKHALNDLDNLQESLLGSVRYRKRQELWWDEVADDIKLFWVLNRKPYSEVLEGPHETEQLVNKT